MIDTVLADPPATAHVQPSWRGWLHAIAFLLAIPGGILLILSSHEAAARTASAIYAGSLLLGFGTSAGYHRLARGVRARQIMQRMDHSMIYVLIAGSYTPICLLGLSLSWGIPMLCVVWTGAVVGILIKLFAFARFRYVESALYPLLGWAAIVATPGLVRGLTGAELLLVVLAGVLYTLGIPVLVRRHPDPWPRTFGYHEVWHVMVVGAAACHYVVILTVVRAAV